MVQLAPAGGCHYYTDSQKQLSPLTVNRPIFHSKYFMYLEQHYIMSFTSSHLMMSWYIFPATPQWLVTWPLRWMGNILQVL